MPNIKLYGVAAVNTRLYSFNTNITNFDWIKGLLPLKRRQVNHLKVYINGQEINRHIKEVSKDDEIIFIAPYGGY